MGLPGVAIKFINFLTVVVSLFAIAAKSLTHVRRLIPSPESANPDEDRTPPPITYYTILGVTDGMSPIFRNVPIHILTSLVKDKVPVMEYAAYLDKRNGASDDDGGGVVAAVCAVCLTAVERTDEIRELCHCSHVFHRECLDRWVDENQVTCPLCRALLFPANWDRRRNCFREDPLKTMTTPERLI